jgi:serum/glucocorticoid-regulated kinase 2
MFQHLALCEFFSEQRAQFYAAEIFLALEFLHSKNIIYRDLKPENLLIDADGHIKLADFGLAKELQIREENAPRTKTFCGTNEYIAPEVILGQSYGESVDWWSLGIVTYEMLTGWPPWSDENREVLFKRIILEPLPFDHENLTSTAKDFLQKMLVKQVEDRIKPSDMKKHPFFSSISFDKLLAKQIAPPFKPDLVHSLFINRNHQRILSM